MVLTVLVLMVPVLMVLVLTVLALMVPVQKVLLVPRVLRAESETLAEHLRERPHFAL
jgi:hypothetical protein